MANLTITVNGEKIPQEAVDFELQRLIQYYAQQGMPENQIRANLEHLRQQAVEQAIGAKLLIEEARRLDIPVTDAELQERFDSFAKQHGGPEKLTETLKQQGLTPEKFKEELRQGRQVDKLVEKAYAGVPMPTEAEIRAFYEENKDRYTTEDRVLAQHILIKPADETPGAKQLAHQTICSIRDRIVNKGTVFGDEAAAHSDCPSGKGNGGSLGWFGRGQMVKPFEDTVFAMALNTVSDVIETQFGYHIIYKTDEEKGRPAEFDEIHDQVRDMIFHSRRGEAVSAYVKELREKATVEIK